MKKNVLFIFLLFSTVTFGQTTTSFPGNNKNSFGGAIGQGSLAITEFPDSISMTLTKGPGPFDSLIVIYLDIVPDGVSSTSVLSGSSTDRYQAAVGGNNPSGGGRAVLNFPTDFQPDGAIVFNKDSGRVYAFITIPFFGTSLLLRNSFSISATGSEFSGGASKETLGISDGPLEFKFVGTYIGQSASRSNESFGDSFEGYFRPAGELSYNPYTITSYFTFPSGPLPVKLKDFTAVKEGNLVNISWLVADETNIDKYDLQRSADGVSFSTIASIKARNSAISSSYSYKDISVRAGTNYYRLVITEKGKTEISKVVYINIKGKNIFAANVTGTKTLNIVLNGVSEGTYKLRMLNSSGQLVQAESLKVDATYKTMQIQLKQNLAKGIYRVAIQSATAKYIANIFVE